MKVAKIDDPKVIDAFYELAAVANINVPEIFSIVCFGQFMSILDEVIDGGQYEIVDRTIPKESAWFDISEIKQGHIFVKIKINGDGK